MGFFPLSSKYSTKSNGPSDSAWNCMFSAPLKFKAGLLFPLSWKLINRVLLASGWIKSDILNFRLLRSPFCWYVEVMITDPGVPDLNSTLSRIIRPSALGYTLFGLSVVKCIGHACVVPYGAGKLNNLIHWYVVIRATSNWVSPNCKQLINRPLTVYNTSRNEIDGRLLTIH